MRAVGRVAAVEHGADSIAVGHKVVLEPAIVGRTPGGERNGIRLQGIAQVVHDGISERPDGGDIFCHSVKAESLESGAVGTVASRMKQGVVGQHDGTSGREGHGLAI